MLLQAAEGGGITPPLERTGPAGKLLGKNNGTGPITAAPGFASFFGRASRVRRRGR